jgi:DNA-binding transcriptional regulator YhcF (GntR family)
VPLADAVDLRRSTLSGGAAKGHGQRAYRTIERVRAADQILGDLRGRILRGEFAHGSRFPAERDLAEKYGVSTGTVREAVRALAATGLVRVRHGSGSYVTGRSETTIAVSLASAIQLEGSPATDVMDILGVLNSHAAGLAARQATDEEIASLRGARWSSTEPRGRRLMVVLSGRGALGQTPIGRLAALQVESGETLDLLGRDRDRAVRHRPAAGGRSVGGVRQFDHVEITDAVRQT